MGIEDTMPSILAQLLLGCWVAVLLVLNVTASVIVLRTRSTATRFKAAYLSLTWLVPIVGALAILYFQSNVRLLDPRSGWGDFLLRAAAALLAFHQFTQLVQTVQVIDVFGVSPADPVWPALVLDAWKAFLSLLGLVAIVVGYRWSVWLFVCLQLVAGLFGYTAQLDTGVFDLRFVSAIAMLIYSAAFARRYFNPVSRNRSPRLRRSDRLDGTGSIRSGA